MRDYHYTDRAKERGIDPEGIESVLRYGRTVSPTRAGALPFKTLTWEDTKHVPELQPYTGLCVVVAPQNGNLITAYWQGDRELGGRKAGSRRYKKGVVK
jgi:hypothetical protein